MDQRPDEARISRRAVLAAGGVGVVAGACLASPVDARGARRPEAVRAAEAFYRTLQAGDLDAFASLWRRDAVWHQPITADGTPGRLVGRDTIVEMLRGALQLFDRLSFEWEIHALHGSPQALAIWSLEHRFVAGGSYVNRGMALFRVRGERIAEFTEHFDTVAWQAAFGR
jgi:ketosteroid isomerase-like protein